MNQIPIETSCNAFDGEGILATGKIYTLAARENPLLNCSSAD